MSKKPLGLRDSNLIDDDWPEIQQVVAVLRVGRPGEARPARLQHLLQHRQVCVWNHAGPLHSVHNRRRRGPSWSTAAPAGIRSPPWSGGVRHGPCGRSPWLSSSACSVTQ